MHNYERPKIGIIGARGYSGLECVRLLLRHPFADLKVCFATDSGFDLRDYLPEMSHPLSASSVAPTVAPIAELKNWLNQLNVIFLATPAEVSVELAPQIIKAGVHVIDLSGAFRLEAKDYPRWYSFEHTSESLTSLQKAHYGLVPWAHAPRATSEATNQTNARQEGQLISNPGCYATSVMMALIPLLKADLLDLDSIVIDAKSGTSGAGKKATENLLFTEVDGECLPYKVANHQHYPEMLRWIQTFSGQTISPHFSTSLLPTRRGIITGIYAKLSKKLNAPSASTSASVLSDFNTQMETLFLKTFTTAYEGYPLVHAASLSSKGSASGLSLKKVVGSARTSIRFKIDGQKVYCYSLIDNLLKGAASQAIENYNQLYHQPPETGLHQAEGVL